MVSASHQPPRNQAWFTFTPGSETVAENARLFPRLVLRAAAPQDEPALDGPHRLRIAFRGHEVLGVEGKHRLERAFAPVGEPVFQRRDRQAGIVRVAGLERAPAGDLHAQRDLRIGERDDAEREPGLEGGIGKARQAVSGAACAIAGAGARQRASGPAPALPARAPTGRLPLTEMAAKTHGSLNTSGRLRSETCDSAPVPSRQIMPAPMPPSGNATWFRYSPEYSVL